MGVEGYRLYYGPQSRIYPANLDAGPATTATVTGLSSGQTYYFVVVAYDRTDGIESVVSNEVSTTLPPSGGPASTLTVSPTSVTAGGTVTATWAGIPSPTAADWLALYAPGASDTASLAWLYTTGTVSGNVPFPIPGTVNLASAKLRRKSPNTRPIVSSVFSRSTARTSSFAAQAGLPTWCFGPTHSA